jgi:hypothetical protein
MTKPMRVPDWMIPTVRLRIKKGPDGNNYLCGLLGGARIFIVRNPDRSKDPHLADFILCFAKSHHQHLVADDAPQPEALT